MRACGCKGRLGGSQLLSGPARASSHELELWSDACVGGRCGSTVSLSTKLTRARQQPSLVGDQTGASSAPVDPARALVTPAPRAVPCAPSAPHQWPTSLARTSPRRAPPCPPQPPPCALRAPHAFQRQLAHLERVTKREKPHHILRSSPSGSPLLLHKPATTAPSTLSPLSFPAPAPGPDPPPPPPAPPCTSARPSRANTRPYRALALGSTGRVGRDESGVGGLVRGAQAGPPCAWDWDRDSEDDEDERVEASDRGSCVVGFAARTGREEEEDDDDAVVRGPPGGGGGGPALGAGGDAAPLEGVAAAVTARGRGGSGGLGALLVGDGEALSVEALRGGSSGAGAARAAEGARVEERGGRGGEGAASPVALLAVHAAEDGLEGGVGRCLTSPGRVGATPGAVSPVTLPALERTGEALRCADRAVSASCEVGEGAAARAPWAKCGRAGAVRAWVGDVGRSPRAFRDEVEGEAGPVEGWM
ncbi:hypothetical protein DMC30DRAFT_31385 [Rhodotorula diobovata]|uniref:Uncharacterized protein n=1 Tax=Rhodotorula diobovata TaxID=5288 RepID=A0A5C5FPP3_9BASI|nr:hypothetical protein DMC30DRAFT_31385 [Rhodotorula diobovata]